MLFVVVVFFLAGVFKGEFSGRCLFWEKVRSVESSKTLCLSVKKKYVLTLYVHVWSESVTCFYDSYEAACVLAKRQNVLQETLCAPSPQQKKNWKKKKRDRKRTPLKVSNIELSLNWPCFLLSEGSLKAYYKEFKKVWLVILSTL